MDSVKPGFYDIYTPYLQYLQKTGDSKAPDWDYHLKPCAKKRKFYYGPVHECDGAIYFVPISHQPEPADKMCMVLPLGDEENGSVNCRYMIPIIGDDINKYLIKKDVSTDTFILQQETHCLTHHAELTKKAEYAFKYGSMDFKKPCTFDTQDDSPCLYNAAYQYNELSAKEKANLFFETVYTRNLKSELIMADLNDWSTRQKQQTISKITETDFTERYGITEQEAFENALNKTFAGMTLTNTNSGEEKE